MKEFEYPSLNTIAYSPVELMNTSGGREDEFPIVPVGADEFPITKLG